jgi:hypothetical protein
MDGSDRQGNEHRGPLSRMPYAPRRRRSQAIAAAPPTVHFAYATRDCYIIIGNHTSYVGIGEILYTLNAYFSRRYRTYVSQSIVPNHINVIIDEFSTDARLEYFRQMKRNHPGTRFVLMATEFITEITLLGFCFGNTFNFFDLQDDYRYLLSLLANRLHLRGRLPYLHARYLGFVQALAVVDLVLCAHPGVSRSMQLLVAEGIDMPRPPLTLYPEIDCDRLADDPRLDRLPAGFVMTGTLTTFRNDIVKAMIKTFQAAGVFVPFYQYVPFDQSPQLRLGDNEVDLGYDEIADPGGAPWQVRDAIKNYLFNLNPPQRPQWSYSSPMRILRAILLGQIPVVTRKFADHAIEQVAMVWDGRVDTAEQLWVDATMGRPELVERHLAAVASYNNVARLENGMIDSALASLD